MAIRDRKVSSVSPQSQCEKCHGDKTIRTIHLLRMRDMGKDDLWLRSHIEQQFPQWDKYSVDSEVNWLGTIARLWLPKAMREKSPLWMAWLEACGYNVSKTPTGWYIGMSKAKRIKSRYDYADETERP